jgi:hypothetical protein
VLWHDGKMLHLTARVCGCDGYGFGGAANAAAPGRGTFVRVYWPRRLLRNASFTCPKPFYDKAAHTDEGGLITVEKLAQHTVLLANGQGRDAAPQAAAILQAGRRGVPHDRFLFEVFCLRVFALATANAAVLRKTNLFEQFWGALYRHLPNDYDRNTVSDRYNIYSQAVSDATDQGSSGTIVGKTFANLVAPGTDDTVLAEYGTLECRAHYYIQRRYAPERIALMTAHIAETLLVALSKGMLWNYVSVLLCIAGLFMAAAIGGWPHAFYVFLRLGVCVVSLYWVTQALKTSHQFWAWALGANAVLFNPVVPIRLERSEWKIVNLLDAAFLASWIVVSIYSNARSFND